MTAVRILARPDHVARVAMHRVMLRSVVAILLATTALRAQTSELASHASPESAQGTLRPGDVVRLRIWREPDLSGDFVINEAGVVVLPRVGPVNVLAMNTDSVRARLFDQYKAILSHQSIEIALLRRVQILGAVRNPGLYPLDPTMTLGDAVAVAGGATADGDQNRVQLVRSGERSTQTLSYHTRVADSAVRSGDQLFVPQRNWFSRHENLLVAMLSTGAGVAIALSR